MANKTCKTLVGIVKDVMIQIDKFSFLVDFVILDIKAYPNMPFNLGRPFMKTMRMLVGIDKGELMVRIKDREMDEEQVNMMEKCDTTLLQTMPTKMKDPSKFTISCTIGGVEIPHALCDLESSINLIPINKVKELKFGEIMPSNVTPTLTNLLVTHHHGVLQDVLVHVDSLVFPADFVMVDMKGDTGGSAILELPFLGTGKMLIDLETGELSLKFNNEKVVFNAYEWTLYADDLETCY
ncbi:uncharacterized protein LOC127080162 [Lathyrus oleraceus]|uniref:uncharacterized protein LOC127080162 n=1 Tax=Pisum sativum TaxID=3888 RepID=UPI0021D344D6|nr:uncharacterized protein LOC127080162 [Pisum sativum]